MARKIGQWESPPKPTVEKNTGPPFFMPEGPGHGVDVPPRKKGREIPAGTTKPLSAGDLKRPGRAWFGVGMGILRIRGRARAS